MKINKIDEKLLDYISQEKTSGEFLAKELGISRTAVWKRINKLKKYGYEIESSKSGYKLLKPDESLLPNNLKKILKTRFIGKEYIYFQEIDSTNNYAKNHPELKHGTVVLAENQIAGKGRKGRKWVSAPQKGLYFSIVLHPQIDVSQILKFSLTFPYAVKLALDKYVKNDIYIKFPNDLYMNNKKFAGILLESEIEGDQLTRVIVGIGINVNNDPEDFEGLEVPATSLKIEEGKTFNRAKILADILKYVEDIYLQCLEGHMDIISKVNEILLWKGKTVKVKDNNSELTGILIGLDQSAGLRIMTEDGEKVIYSGDLTLRTN